jgi:hypothetical protein
MPIRSHVADLPLFTFSRASAHSPAPAAAILSFSKSKIPSENSHDRLGRTEHDRTTQGCSLRLAPAAQESLIYHHGDNHAPTPSLPYASYERHRSAGKWRRNKKSIPVHRGMLFLLPQNRISASSTRRRPCSTAGNTPAGDTHSRPVHRDVHTSAAGRASDPPESIPAPDASLLPG